MKTTPEFISEPSPLSLREAVRTYEKTLIHATLVACEWNQRKACEVLNVLPTTLSEKIRRFDLRPPGATPRGLKTAAHVLVPAIRITKPRGGWCQSCGHETS
jgi:hypothetical protein